ncbi:MAG TPA: FGGY-family carbohydrate kinase [Acidobacteriaceae bacterium]|jgi:rhamnulokinase
MSQAGLVADGRALVAIDLGAESCRVSLLRWHQDGPRMELVHRFPNHAQERLDGLHWDLQGILAGLQAGLAKCAEVATEGIRSIGVDGWGVDYVRLDEQGKPVADPFCYRDERTIAAQQGLHERISEERMRELTGLQILRLNSVYQMFADSSELRHDRWLQLPEYVLYALGGRPVAEFTNATHTQMVGLDGSWSAEILRAADLPLETMPELVPAGTDVGELSGETAKLPAFAGARLIAPACHDTASAIAAIPDQGDDWAYISSGTWSLVGTLLDAPLNTPEAREENFTNLGGADGRICFHKNVNGMWLLRQCMECWETQGVSHDIADLVRGAAGRASLGYVLDVDDPDLLLPGHMPERINAQLRSRGLDTLNEHPDEAVAMAAFLFHSLAGRYAEVLSKVAQITGKPLRKLYMMGGGSQNEMLNRLTAEVTGLEVIKAGVECSTLGNFSVQLATLEQTGKETTRPAALWASRLSAAPSQ